MREYGSALELPESTIRDHPRSGVAGVDAGAGRKSLRRGRRPEGRSRSQPYAITALDNQRDESFVRTDEMRLQCGSVWNAYAAARLAV